MMMLCLIYDMHVVWYTYAYIGHDDEIHIPIWYTCWCIFDVDTCMIIWPNMVVLLMSNVVLWLFMSVWWEIPMIVLWSHEL